MSLAFRTSLAGCTDVSVRTRFSPRGNIPRRGAHFVKCEANKAGQDKVLVIGANGRVGQRIVKKLSEQGVPTRGAVRDPDSATAKSLATLPGVEIVKADVVEAESVAAAMRGCQSCVACFGGSRLSSLTDILGQAHKDPAHPANINHQGVINIIQAAKSTAGFKKLVRVTGLAAGYSAFNPITLLMNTIISMTIQCQARGEAAIRASGLDYIIVRPGSMTDEPQPGTAVFVSSGRGLLTHPVGKVSRQDVADLCVASVNHSTSRATLGITAPKQKEGGKESSRTSWEQKLDEAVPDPSNPMPEQPYRAAVAAFLSLVAYLMYNLISMIFHLLKSVFV